MLEAVLILFAFVLATTWILLYQILRQQGRLLLRIEEIEERSELAGAIGDSGLAEGVRVEHFDLPDLSGGRIRLASFAGRQVLLVNWNPACGFCESLASDLARLVPKLRDLNTEVLLVSSGSVSANQALAETHALACPIVLQGESKIEIFENLGSPVAYLLDKSGRIAAPLAVGASEILYLASRVGAPSQPPRSKGLSQSSIERNGIKRGTLAPAFELPGIRGQSVSLEAYRGRKVLLIFSDPNCGPCDALAPALTQLHHERPDDLAILMVSRGDADENQQKALQHGFEFPVVLQDRWKLSKQYGIFSTPVGFLIDEDGIVEREVATGGEQILALARAD